MVKSLRSKLKQGARRALGVIQNKLEPPPREICKFCSNFDQETAQRFLSGTDNFAMVTQALSPEDMVRQSAIEEGTDPDEAVESARQANDGRVLEWSHFGVCSHASELVAPTHACDNYRRRW
jgi:hypothetical protein